MNKVNIDSHAFRLPLFFIFPALIFALATSSAQDRSSERLTETEKANAIFEHIFEGRLDRDPELQTRLGIKRHYGSWADDSEEAALLELELQKRNLRVLKNSIDFEKLNTDARISYRMAVQEAEDFIRHFKFRHYAYAISHMEDSPHVYMPAFLINYHKITDLVDAEAYLARLSKFDEKFAQVIEQIKWGEQSGIIPPRFVYSRAIDSCRNVIRGIPFEENGEECALLADFVGKIANLEIDEAIRSQLIERGKKTLLKDVKPAYDALIAYLENQYERASDDAGVWKFPDGEAYYNERLQLTTTTDLTSDEIHEYGLREVDRIHGEMRELMRKLEYSGSLQEFFEFTRTDDQFYYPNTDEGRQTYLDRAVAVIDEMRNRLDSLFITKPKAELIVKRVEAFREQAVGIAFYRGPAENGSRPGIYYANLYNMRNMPKYMLEGLAYHEGIPGHHMQIAIAGEMEDLPRFRKYAKPLAYHEGWGLYCELLPKEIGLYSDPYSDYGRLTMELWRACRLVVDTGIHARRWTREEGIAYYQSNTPQTERNCVRMVERHIVWPSQATAYKVGMLKITELRERAKAALGNEFDIRQFHDVILRNGPIPLNILEESIDRFISSGTN